MLWSVDMPIADIRRILTGADEAERQQIFRDHRDRLAARLDEVPRLLEVVDTMSKETSMGATTGMTTWLHLMPKLPVADIERSIAYYQEALGLDLAWRTVDGKLAAMATGEIEVLLLVPWVGEGAPPEDCPTGCVTGRDLRVRG